MARQRSSQSGRSAARGIQDPAQDVGADDAGTQDRGTLGGDAPGGALGGAQDAGAYGGSGYGASAAGSATAGRTYGGGTAGGGGFGSSAYGGSPQGSFAQGTSAQGGRAQSGAAQGGVIDEAKQTAQRLASQAQDKAGEQVQSGLTSGKNRAAETLNSVAQSLYNSSQQLRDQNQAAPSRYIEQAAGRVERVANYLRQTDVNQIVDQVESFARRQPALFLGGAFALGLVGARFLKSSRSKVYGDVPHDRAVVPYRAGSDRTTAAIDAGFDRATGSPRASAGLADRGAWRGAPSTGASTTGDRTLSATGGAGLGGQGSYDDTSHGQTDFGGTPPSASGDDRI